MDVLLSIVTGLALRLLLSDLDHPLGRFVPILLGLWEGVAVYHLSVSSSLDHYLAYTLRVAIDLYFTGNFLRTLIILLFTILGVVVCEFLNPAKPRRVHRRRSSRTSVPARARHDVPEPLPTSSTPVIRPSRPHTPPSIFLEGESESNSPQPEYLPSVDPDDDDESPAQHVLPTPPSTLASEVRDSRAVDRLSTIEEQSSGEEGSRRSFTDAVPGAFAPRDVTSYAPSISTPLPVPNSTIRYIHTSISRASASSAIEPSPPTGEPPPLPVPNSSSQYMTDDDGGDPLQTPPVRSSGPWELALTDNNDGLTTPPGRELSPLVLEHALLPSFGQASASADDGPSASSMTTEVAAAQLVPSAVEYPSAPVAPPRLNLDPDPVVLTIDPELDDPDPGSSPDELEQDEPEPESSYPTPIASPTVERLPQQAPNTDIHIENADQETETETDAASSVISSHPMNIMYLRAEALRQEARAAEKEHERLQICLKRAQSVKDMIFLKHQVQEEEERARRLHGKAAKRFFEARNVMRKRRPHTIDLHGLRVAEALSRTEQALRDAFNAGAPLVRVIVGKGLHSAGRHPVLKETIMRIMNKYGVACRVDPGNAGVLILTLAST